MDEKQDELTPYLSSSFLKDIGNITSLSKAKDVLDKYGTHLLMGYTLGGVLEMTNYFASKSSTYVKQVNDSFKVQVDAAINASKIDASASVGGSFSDSYTKMDNTDESTNSYRCTTYGGEAFTSLSIEQVFSYYSNAIDSGYLYNVWTRSINKGTDLTIVEVPESTPMVPLYQVLPLDSKYDKARAYLVEEYLMVCKDVLSDYRNKNKEIVVNDLKEAENAAKGKVNVKGFNSIAMGDTDNLNEYTEVTKNNLTLKQGSVVSLDFNYEDFDNDILEWKAVTGSGSAAKGVTVLDKKSGIFKVDYNSDSSF